MEKEIVNDYKLGLNVKKLAKKYHVSFRKITSILLNNGIDIHDPNRDFGPRHKMPDGYWSIKSNNEIAASKFRNRRDFSLGNSTAYKIAKEKGWINEYDEKYFSKEIKYYGFDEPIHVVYAYEFIDLNYVYIGRTMDLKRRDCCHRNATQNDSVYKFAKEHNIEVPTVKILSEKLTARESQKFEDEFKNQYAENKWNLINKAQTGEGSGSLGAIPRKWTYETCREAAETYQSKEEFKKKFSRAHNVSRKCGWIEEFFPENKKKKNGYFNVFENCLEEAKNYSSIADIRKNYPFLYHKMLKNQWADIIKEKLNF